MLVVRGLLFAVYCLWIAYRRCYSLCLFGVRWLMRVAWRLVLAVCSLFVERCVLCGVRYSLFAVYGLLDVVRCLMFVVKCLMVGVLLCACCCLLRAVFCVLCVTC